MTNFNYGHSELFWELLIQAIEDESLTKSQRRILIISPGFVTFQSLQAP